MALGVANIIIYISAERRWRRVAITDTGVIIDTSYNMEPADAGIYGPITCSYVIIRTDSVTTQARGTLSENQQGNPLQ